MELPTGRETVSRILPLMPKISKTLRHHQDDPLSPYHSEPDLESATHDVEKPQRCAVFRKKAFSKTRAASAPRSPRTLMTLPHEIQIMVISYLRFADIIRLRRTSMYWRFFATPQLLRTVHGPERLHMMLLQHCRHCLDYCPVDTTRTATTHTDPGYPLSSRCVTCVVQSKDNTIRAGRQVTLADAVDYWTCRWCGWPVTRDPEAGQPEFHKWCYHTYFFGGVLSWVVLGCIQFALGLVGSALVWHYFRTTVAAWGPTAIAFVLSCLCLLHVASRDCYKPTYFWSVMMETSILVTWVRDHNSRFLHKKLFVAINSQVGLPRLTRTTSLR